MDQPPEVKTVRGTQISSESRQSNEAVREACLRAATEGYEEASLHGLCPEGAWEAAISAIRRIDLGALDDAASPNRRSMAPIFAVPTLADATADLALRFATSGAPSAGSGAAACGAIAAGLLEWVAHISEKGGPARFRRRSRTIAGWAALLRSALASRSQTDAEIVAAWIAADGASRPDVRRQATDSLIAIGTRCARVAALAAEVAAGGHPLRRPDGETAARLAWAASSCTLDLAEEYLDLDAGEMWAAASNRRIWRARLVLQRVSPDLPGGRKFTSGA